MADDMIGNADERRRLLGELELERNQLMRNIETCRIRDIDRPFIGSWSLKDIVGHIASWEAEVVIPTGSAAIEISARATDTAGETQPEAARFNASGYGNNSIHRVSVRARG